MAAELEDGRSGPIGTDAAPDAEALALGRYPDILQAAWGLSDAEFETILRLPAGTMRQWRNHELCFANMTLARLGRLFLLHESLRFGALGHPPNFAAFVRREWETDSVTGGGTMIDVLSRGDDQALEQLERYLRSVD